MAQFFIAIYLVPTKDDIADDALNAWQLWVTGGDGDEPTIRASVERILLQEWSQPIASAFVEEFYAAAFSK